MMGTGLQILYMEPLGVGIILVAISVVYFVAGHRQPVAKRIVKSSHAILFLCAMYPVVLDKFSLLTGWGWFGYPFWVFLVLGIASTVYSLGGYARHWSLHIVHVFTMLYGALAALFGMSALSDALF